MATGLAPQAYGVASRPSLRVSCSEAGGQCESPTIRDSLLGLEEEGKEVPPGRGVTSLACGCAASGDRGCAQHSRERPGTDKEEGWATQVTAWTGCRTERGERPHSPQPHAGSQLPSPLRRSKAVPGPWKRTPPGPTWPDAGTGGRCGVGGPELRTSPGLSRRCHGSCACGHSVAGGV